MYPGAGDSKTRSLRLEKTEKADLSNGLNPPGRTHHAADPRASRNDRTSLLAGHRDRLAETNPSAHRRRDRYPSTSPTRPPLPRAARSQGPNRRPQRPTGPCPHGPMPPDPCRCHRARTVTVRDQPNSPHCAPKSAPMGVPTSIVIVRGPQSTHPPLTGRRYRTRHNRSNIRPSTSRAAISPGAVA